MSTISNSRGSVQINGAPLTTDISAENSTLLTDAIDNRIAKSDPWPRPSTNSHAAAMSGA